ncbi:MAG: hydroxymethylglutaryl-CoA synthase family protein [Gammaproteobacteria bacterium]
MIGITAYGAYLPRMRLQKKVIAEANGWFDASLKGLGRGEKAVCNWDEDPITMAVEAASDCYGDTAKSDTGGLIFASTSGPFLDRQHSVVVAEALNLDIDSLRTADVTASQRAATSALLFGLDIAAGSKASQVMVVGSEHRRTQVATREEMLYGDGAAALSVGSQNVIAEFIESHSTADDFIDHYRADGSKYDYGWEERWVRDEGYMKIVPKAVKALLEKAKVDAADIKHFILATDQARVPAMLGKTLGLNGEAIADNLLDRVGITGAAHPLLLLAHRLEEAAPNDLILVVGFGQGCDALLFRATDAIGSKKPHYGVSGHLARGRANENYNKFQSFNNLLDKGLGKRAEVDKQSYLSAMYRNRAFTTGFKGAKCTACGTVQIPMHRYCVNPECGAEGTQVEHAMAGATGHIQTWTADELTFDFNPPAYFGMVVFEGGGRLMMDITEVDREVFDTGVPVSVHFRVKQIDSQRGFRKYFWKAIQAD